jgi:hypothetical protein
MRRLAILAVTAAFPLILAAARITTRDGTVFDGTFVRGNSNTIEFQDNQGINHRFDVRDVQMLDFGGRSGYGDNNYNSSQSYTTEDRVIRAPAAGMAAA